MSDKPVLPRALYPAELRVLGTLIEKAATTPDQYPLSLNAVRVGCNQKTSRDPVVEYDERTVQTALSGLSQLGLIRDFIPPDSRVVRYEHKFGLKLDLRNPQVALLAVLMLRGAQTPGELRQNAARLHAFESTEQLIEVLERLATRTPQPLVLKIARGPGQREDRYLHLLGDRDAALAAAAEAHNAAASAPAPYTAATADNTARDQELDDLRAALAALTIRVSALEARLGNRELDHDPD
jgi:uncharacterized protein YceH (UPF0502 family)